eukprot:10262487-Karenia_brevis.AAC.2
MPRYSAWGLERMQASGERSPHMSIRSSVYNSLNMRDSLSAGACPGALFELFAFRGDFEVN